MSRIQTLLTADWILHCFLKLTRWWVSQEVLGSLIVSSPQRVAWEVIHLCTYSPQFPFLPLEISYCFIKLDSEILQWIRCLVLYLEQGNNETALSMLWYGNILTLLQGIGQDIFIPRSKQRKSAIFNITRWQWKVRCRAIVKRKDIVYGHVKIINA